MSPSGDESSNQQRALRHVIKHKPTCRPATESVLNPDLTTDNLNSEPASICYTRCLRYRVHKLAKKKTARPRNHLGQFVTSNTSTMATGPNLEPRAMGPDFSSSSDSSSTRTPNADSPLSPNDASTPGNNPYLLGNDGEAYPDEFALPSLSATLVSPTPHLVTNPQTCIPSPAPQPPPTTVTPPPDDTDMADVNAGKLFQGNGKNGENPRDFMKALNRMYIMKNYTEAQKIQFFKYSIADGSAAEKWYKGLTTNQKTKWSDIEAAFDIKWPQETTPKLEKQKKLAEWKIREDELGTTKEVNGTNEQAHVHWANRAEELAEDIPDSDGLLIDSTRQGLPPTLRGLVGSQHTTWKSFCDAVRAVTLEAIQEKQQLTRSLTAVQRLANDLQRTRINDTNAAIAALSNSMKAISIQPQGLSTPAMSPAYTPAYPIYQNRNYGYGSQQGGQRTPRRSDEERLPDILNARARQGRHPPTPEGQAAYQREVDEYHRAHGSMPLDETRPYPLTPGTAPVNALDPVVEQKWWCLEGAPTTQSPWLPMDGHQAAKLQPAYAPKCAPRPLVIAPKLPARKGPVAGIQLRTAWGTGHRLGLLNVRDPNNHPTSATYPTPSSSRGREGRIAAKENASGFAFKYYRAPMYPMGARDNACTSDRSTRYESASRSARRRIEVRRTARAVKDGGPASNADNQDPPFFVVGLRRRSCLSWRGMKCLPLYDTSENFASQS
ncbi:hypothetical protein BJ165DRAFT_1531474 [Panaeolus papilionaceus]|nr:hypothetical protein BJ165DRAFT_1531474 [Panaeolus papilionaceus]